MPGWVDLVTVSQCKDVTVGYHTLRQWAYRRGWERRRAPNGRNLYPALVVWAALNARHR